MQDVRGAFPHLQREIRSERCNHCENASCVRCCPTGASHVAKGGIVLVNRDECTGCKACITSCPYDARFVSPEGYADKCTFCIHRVKQGLDPACVAVRPTKCMPFGDRAKNGTPHHGFMAFYLYLENIFRADALIHVGTHGALEFMPGKQTGLSGCCWPDRLIREFPNIYIYSVNNPSEGSVAKRRSYAELVSYLTPPIENAGLYRDLAALKELISNYRQVQDETQKEQLFVSIKEKARDLNLELKVS